MTEAKIKYTAETITCYPINMESLNNMVNEFFHKDNPNLTTEYRLHGKSAIVREPSMAVIDEEFIGGDIETEVTWHIYETETKPGGGKIGHVVPRHEFTLTLFELELYLEAPIGKSFIIIGKVAKAMSRGKIPQEEIDKFHEEATSC